MPPNYPRISGDELVSALRRLGFEKARQKGSHVVLKRGSAGCVVPLHKELKTGTFSGILKQAGVALEDIEKHL